MENQFHLERFVAAQDKVYETVLEELSQGKKQSHWMWFIFPQTAGLGRTETAKKYALGSLDEAKAYLSHPVLGARLLECTKLVLAIDGKSANTIFGHPDDLKFKSSMTLFLLAAPNTKVFQSAIDKFYNGDKDELTVEIIGI